MDEIKQLFVQIQCLILIMAIRKLKHNFKMSEQITNSSNDDITTTITPISKLESSFQQAYRKLDRDISRSLAKDDEEQRQHDETVNRLMAKISGGESDLTQKLTNESQKMESKLHEMIQRADAESEIRRREHEWRMKTQRESFERERNERERLEAQRRDLEESIARRRNRDWERQRDREREALRKAEEGVARSSMAIFVPPTTTSAQSILDVDAGLTERFALAREIERLKEQREILELQRARQRREMKLDQEREKEEMKKEIEKLQMERNRLEKLKYHVGE